MVYQVIFGNHGLLSTLILSDVCRYVSTFQMVTWWGIQVTSKQQLWLARLLMRL